eukprot:gene29164-32387_t
MSVASTIEAPPSIPSTDYGDVDGNGHEFGLFVGDLAHAVTEEALLKFYSESYPSTCSAKPRPPANPMSNHYSHHLLGSFHVTQSNAASHFGSTSPYLPSPPLAAPSSRDSAPHVIVDHCTGRSKGFGFVHFSSATERDLSATETNGALLHGRAICVSEAIGGQSHKSTPSKRVCSSSSKSSSETNNAFLNSPHPADYDPTNTTLFIGGLSSYVTDTHLRQLFGKYGEIIYTKVPKGKGCGFVQFVARWPAHMAFMEMNGVMIGNSALRISWGRSSSKLAAELACGHQKGAPPPRIMAPPMALMPQTQVSLTSPQGSMPASYASYSYPTYYPTPYCTGAPAANMSWSQAPPQMYAPSYPMYYMCSSMGNMSINGGVPPVSSHNLYNSVPQTAAYKSVLPVPSHNLYTSSPPAAIYKTSYQSLGSNVQVSM